MSAIVWPSVSFGTNIRRPYDLRSEDMGGLLGGIGGGQWAEQVHEVRKLDHRSSMQAKIKEQLPYWTPSGLFRYRSAKGLIRHSGHVAIDLDDLGVTAATGAIQQAVADPYCKCAYRSASAQGVRLIFRCPPCSTESHRTVFKRIADHVRSRYGLEPDLSGQDVSRASFVSFDSGIWINLKAAMLPGWQLTAHKDLSLCVVGGLTEGDIETLAWGLGESRAPTKARSDGTCCTHVSLRDLARDLVARFQRHGLTLAPSHLETSLRAWQMTAKRRGLRFRHPMERYREELANSVYCVKRVPWLQRVVQFWSKWSRHQQFPRGASSTEKLEWAIRHHCTEANTWDFYLSARDAATITGTCFKAANDALHRLVRSGLLIRVGERQHPRHAQSYRLTEETAKTKTKGNVMRAP